MKAPHPSLAVPKRSPSPARDPKTKDPSEFDAIPTPDGGYLIHSGLVGQLIGRGGQHFKEITAKTGARLWVDNHDAGTGTHPSHKPLSFKGTPPAVARAKQMVLHWLEGERASQCSGGGSTAQSQETPSTHVSAPMSSPAASSEPASLSQTPSPTPQEPATHHHYQQQMTIPQTWTPPTMMEMAIQASALEWGYQWQLHYAHEVGSWRLLRATVCNISITPLSEDLPSRAAADAGQCPLFRVWGGWSWGTWHGGAH
jgi:KH domain